jgi:hypothetical protein
MNLPEQRRQNLSNSYDKICASYHAIDDFRMKLLGVLPIASGAGVFLLLNGSVTDPMKNEEVLPLLVPIGIFGIIVTLGLLCFELYGIKKCDRLIKAGIQLEDSLQTLGQFNTRPRGVFRYVNEPFAAGVIYPAVLAGWTWLALYSVSEQQALALAEQQALALAKQQTLAQSEQAVPFIIFFFGFIGILIYNIYLTKGDTKEQKRKETKVLYIKSTNGLAGSQEAFNKLGSCLPTSSGRKFYGTFYYPDSPYRACATIKNRDDPKTWELGEWTVPGGNYAYRKLENWTNHTWEIPEIFASLSKEYQGNVDSKRPCIEFYKDQKELLLFLPIRRTRKRKFWPLGRP